MLLKEFKCANKVKVGLVFSNYLKNDQLFPHEPSLNLVLLLFQHSLRHGLKKDNISSKESLLEDVKEFTKKAKENITLQKTTRNEDCFRVSLVALKFRIEHYSSFSYHFPFCVAYNL